jgi:glycosyltransferase involved in cell wall biosynthesis
MKQINVLLISPLPPPVGGIATWTMNLKTHIEKNLSGIKLTIVDSTQKNMSITSESIFDRIFHGISNSLRIYSETKKCILKGKPTVIHLTSTSSLALFRDLLIINLGRQKRIPVIMHWRFGRISLLAKSRNWEWKLLKFVIRNSFCSIVLDIKAYNALLAAGLTNIYNIPNPLGPDFCSQAKQYYDNPSPKKDYSIVFVGHLIKEKGIYELVEACSQISVIKELLLIGPYEKLTETKLLQLADKRENAAWLKLTGTLNRADVLEAMQYSPVLVLPSYTEGFPNVILEAMAMGCAVIATDVGAIPEMLAISSETPCGICIPVKNAEKLKEAITSLAEDPGKAKILGTNGNNRVLQIYQLEKVVEQYKVVWEIAADNNSKN